MDRTISALDVSFQQAVHPVGTEEADIVVILELIESLILERSMGILPRPVNPNSLNRFSSTIRIDNENWCRVGGARGVGRAVSGRSGP